MVMSITSLASAPPRMTRLYWSQLRMTANPRGQASRRKVLSSEVEAGGRLESTSNILARRLSGAEVKVVLGPGRLENGASDIKRILSAILN